MTTTKSVRFETAPSAVFSYPRVEAADITNVFYQEEDYRQFRRAFLLESSRQARSEARRLRAVESLKKLPQQKMLP
jgi:hypothetical protein